MKTELPIANTLNSDRCLFHAHVGAAIKNVRAISGPSVSERCQYLVVSLALAMLQVAFILPVIFALTFRS